MIQSGNFWIYHHIWFLGLFQCLWTRLVQWYSAGLRAEWSRVRIPAGAGNFSLHHRIQTGSEAHQLSYPMGTRALSLGIKRPGREACQSPPSSAEVKNAWSYTSTPPLRLHGVVLSYEKKKHRDNFTFYFHASDVQKTLTRLLMTWVWKDKSFSPIS
jgi:hypothetical protein